MKKKTIKLQKKHLKKLTFKNKKQN